ncbi:hypothetical protein [Streptomyces sp. NPDC017529]|uniref:hypothetical protein n=1 Tax=Streptomyces sp. NPDC017529 TaxID=3365000 RepID=UPI0037A6FB46
MTDGSQLRLVMSECALLLPEPPPTRGPVALYVWDPNNEWDGSRPFEDDERSRIEAAMTAAGCTTT